MNLPRGKLVETLRGGPEVLRKLVADFAPKHFNGYIKVDSVREDTDAHGILILMDSLPVMAIYIWKERIFGQPSLKLVLRETHDDECSLKVFSLPDEAMMEMSNALNRFQNARIDWNAFDIDRETAILNGETDLPPSMTREPARAAIPVPDVDKAMGFFKSTIASQPAPMKNTSDGSVKSQEEASALYKSMAEMGVDTTDIKRKEDELHDTELELRKELDEKVKERDRLKEEEESFLKMDEVFSKLLRQREDELKSKENELTKKMAELQIEINKRAEDLANREEDIRREIERLTREKEEMKHREEKLLEMEKMFRRVLTNTEERLKKKEEELLRKEEELERVVRKRMQELEELRSQTLRSVPAGAQMPDDFRKMEDLLRNREKEIKTREVEFESRLRTFQAELAEHERKKASPGAGAPAARYSEEDLVTLFRHIDSLLDKLPADIINGFANSEIFNVYESMMVKLGIVKK